MITDSETPDTIVLIHGFWVTPRSWEHWIERYERAGYRVLAPSLTTLAAQARRSTSKTPAKSLTRSPTSPRRSPPPIPSFGVAFSMHSASRSRSTAMPVRYA
jgi:pimeloyl-ACP methyl ester carboxylesterase